MSNRILRYKYVPFNDGSLSIISEGTIKFTSPLELNDPFDCVPEINATEYIKHFSSRKDLLKKAGDHQGLTSAKRISKKSRMLKRLEHDLARDDFIKELSRKVGICSLTRDPLNLLMWAHYAKDHTGFVVEFSIPLNVTCTMVEANKCLFDWLIPLEVEYSVSKPILDSFEDKELNMKKNFLIKGMDWKYEKEERVIDNWRGPGIHAYDRKKILKSVIAGIRMKDEHIKTLRSRIDAVNQDLNTDICLYTAEPLIR